MATREAHLELLLGKKVLDPTGAVVGRIEEVLAEQQGDDCVVQAYLIGQTALLERMSAWTIGLALLHMLGARKSDAGHVVPWDKLDLSDLDRPRLCCKLEELAELERQAKHDD